MILNALPALQGFFTIGVLIAVGWSLARIGLLGVDHRKMMSTLAFYVASPALMFTMVSTADLDRVFARSVLASYGAILVAALIYVLVSTALWHHDLSGRVIGTFLSCYSNAGNLGIPVAAYALGDVTWMAPILLIQMVILQPFGLALLDSQKSRVSGEKPSVLSVVTLPFRNPLTVGVLLGLAVNLIHSRVDWFALPGFVSQPIEMVGAVAVPLMLLACGVSLCLDPKPSKGPDMNESWFLVVVKIVLQPLAAYTLARLLGLDPVAVHAVTVVACLPPAQNIFVFASKYGVRMTFARDTIFRATLCSVAVILIAATVLA